YPLFVFGVGNLFFHDKAIGSIISRNGIAVGSQLIGQNFSRPEYFHGRPSAAGEKGYDASNSAGSNLGPTNQKLQERVQASVENFLKSNPIAKKGEIPTQMVTTSASGLDPDISPEAAYAQADRVAQSRNAKVRDIRSLIDQNTQGPQLGILGEAV